MNKPTAWATGLNGGGDMGYLALDCHDMGLSKTRSRGKAVGIDIDIFGLESINWRPICNRLRTVMWEFYLSRFREAKPDSLKI